MSSNRTGLRVTGLSFPPFRGDILYEEELCLELKETLIGSFCDGAVRIVTETARPVSHVDRELGVNEGTLDQWVRQDRCK